jgi:serine/threonine protein phosphatase PrpC
MEEAYGNAFVKANKAMHKEKFDDSLSGTTAITAYVLGDTLYVANVGDSRAIIASADDSGKNRSSPLSLDQTPFRLDERERLKKKGARIMTLDQIEGNDTLHENWGNGNGDEIDESGDPPRVWDSTLERPGCAFTRSLGDSVAEQVGVYAVPEILTWKITPQDRFMVIASDGVFEFLTSQAVVDMVSEFDDPLEAAKHVVSESYRLWLTYDDRTDDITVIIVTFSNFGKPASLQSTSSKRSTSAKRESDAKTMLAVESKPVRRVMSKEKRKVISESWADEEKEEFNFEANSSPKTPEELSRIEEMVRANFMFQSLSKQQRDQIFMIMKLRTVAAGELIIQEGDAGDAMYIVDSGEFSVLKKDENGINQPVFSYTSPGAAFGELSLMYGKPRAASVRAKTAGRLWSISRQAFRSVLMKRRQAGLLKTMQELPFFVNVSYPQLQRICELSTEETFNDNEVVATHSPNDRSWTVMVVLQGRLFIVKPDGTKESPRNPGMFLARVHLESTNLKAIASGRTKIARIPSAVFSEIMGGDGDDLLRSFQDYSSIVRHATILTKHENVRIQGVSTRNSYQLQSVMTTLGDYAYVGNFIDTTKSNAKVTIKVIAKQKAYEARMADRLLQEKAYLVALSSKAKYLSNIASKCVDAKVLLLVYEDNFVCDISAAIINDALSLNAKKFCTSAIFSALEQLHLNGVMHRFLNSSSVYMTDRCVPKLTDLRYAKKMDGSKTFTICGDPLYFAPEIIGQQGYDYSADLWAFGILAYEIFEVMANMTRIANFFLIISF